MLLNVLRNRIKISFTKNILINSNRKVINYLHIASINKLTNSFLKVVNQFK